MKDGKAERETQYVLGRTAEETERLQAQAVFVQPFTERLFRDAGLGRGMKVLDLGDERKSFRFAISLISSAAQSGTQNSGSETHLRVRRPRPVVPAG